MARATAGAPPTEVVLNMKHRRFAPPHVSFKYLEDSLPGISDLESVHASRSDAIIDGRACDIDRRIVSITARLHRLKLKTFYFRLAALLSISADEVDMLKPIKSSAVSHSLHHLERVHSFVARKCG